MDALDKKIVLELMQDCRQSLVELSTKIGLSVAQLKRRLKKLEEQSVIENYVTELSANLFREGFVFSYLRTKTKMKTRNIECFLKTNFTLKSLLQDIRLGLIYCYLLTIKTAIL